MPGIVYVLSMTRASKPSSPSKMERSCHSRSTSLHTRDAETHSTKRVDVREARPISNGARQRVGSTRTALEYLLVACMKPRDNGEDQLLDVYRIPFTSELELILDLKAQLSRLCKRKVYSIHYRGLRCSPSQTLLQFHTFRRSWLAFTAFVSGKQKRAEPLFLKDLQGNNHVVPLLSTTTIAQLERMASELLDLPTKGFVLLYRGKQLSTGQGRANIQQSAVSERTKLLECGVGANSVVEVSTLVKGGAGHFTFPDISDQSTYTWVNFGPHTHRSWLVCHAGLVFKGTCRNPSCEAYLNVVYCNKGMGFFDVKVHKETCVCPACKQAVIGDSPGFNRCQWQFEGVKQNGEECSNKWITAGNRYEYFKGAPLVTWKHLVIMTRSPREQMEPDMERLCVVCEQPIPTGTLYSKGPKCHHSFHQQCLGNLLASGSDKCPACKELLLKQDSPPSE